MAATKNYLHDHIVLLLLTVNGFLALAGSIFIAVKLTTGHSNGYIVQCRDCSNPAAINKFSTGHLPDLLSLIVFAILVFCIHTVLSLRSYRINRQLSLAVLCLGTLLLTLTIIIGNSLLALR